MLLGEAERRAFFLLDMMIGLLGGESGSRDGVARPVAGFVGLPRASVDLEGVPRAVDALVGVPKEMVALEGLPTQFVVLEGVRKEMVDLEGVPSSFRGVPRRPAVGLEVEAGVVGVTSTDLEGVPLAVEGVTRTDLEGVLLGELPSSKRLTLDGVL